MLVIDTNSIFMSIAWNFNSYIGCIVDEQTLF